METAENDNKETTVNGTVKQEDPDNGMNTNDKPKIITKYQLVPENCDLNGNYIYLNPNLLDFMEVNGVYLENGHWVQLPRYFKPLRCPPNNMKEKKENDLPKEEQNTSQMSPLSDNTEPQVQPNSDNKFSDNTEPQVQPNSDNKFSDNTEPQLQSNSDKKFLPNGTEQTQNIPQQFPHYHGQFWYPPRQFQHPPRPNNYSTYQGTYPRPNGIPGGLPHVHGPFPYALGPSLLHGVGPRFPGPSPLIPTPANVPSSSPVGQCPLRPGLFVEPGTYLPGLGPNVIRPSPSILGPRPSQHKLGLGPNVIMISPSAPGSRPIQQKSDPWPRVQGPGTRIPGPISSQHKRGLGPRPFPGPHVPILGPHVPIPGPRVPGPDPRFPSLGQGPRFNRPIPNQHKPDPRVLEPRSSQCNSVSGTNPDVPVPNHEQESKPRDVDPEEHVPKPCQHGHGPKLPENESGQHVPNASETRPRPHIPDVGQKIPGFDSHVPRPAFNVPRRFPHVTRPFKHPVQFTFPHGKQLNSQFIFPFGQWPRPTSIKYPWSSEYNLHRYFSQPFSPNPYHPDGLCQYPFVQFPFYSQNHFQPFVSTCAPIILTGYFYPVSNGQFAPAESKHQNDIDPDESLNEELTDSISQNCPENITIKCKRSIVPPEQIEQPVFVSQGKKPIRSKELVQEKSQLCVERNGPIDVQSKNADQTANLEEGLSSHSDQKTEEIEENIQSVQEDVATDDETNLNEQLSMINTNFTSDIADQLRIFSENIIPDLQEQIQNQSTELENLSSILSNLDEELSDLAEIQSLDIDVEQSVNTDTITSDQENVIVPIYDQSVNRRQLPIHEEQETCQDPHLPLFMHEHLLPQPKGFSPRTYGESDMDIRAPPGFDEIPSPCFDEKFVSISLDTPPDSEDEAPVYSNIRKFLQSNEKGVERPKGQLPLYLR